MLGAAWLGALLALHPLPHTGALRSLLLAIAIVHVGYWIWQQRSVTVIPHCRAEAILLAAMTAWLLLQATFLATSPGRALIELGREWGKLLVMVALGIGIAASAHAIPKCAEQQARWLCTGLFLGFFMHPVTVLGYQGWQLAAGGRLQLGESLLGNYGYVSLPVNAALAMLLADAAERFCHDRRLLPFSNVASVAAVAVILLATALLTAKAGLIMTHVLGWTFLAAVLRQGTRFRWTAVLSVTVALVAVTAAAVALENRWAGAVSAIASGVATAELPDGNEDAQSDIPTIRSPIQRIDGNDPSFFFRSSWAMIGLQGIGQAPLGLGYGADAFGRYVAQRYGVTGFVSSHSGWIDFTLANGIPALLLLLALSGFLAIRGWGAFRAGNIAGFALCLTVINYIGRCAMDGYLTGSRLTAFALMMAVLWGLSAPARGEASARPT